MQILSLALLSTHAEESWSIYEALHPDLRPAIPDDIFTSLMSRQLNADKKLKRERLVELANLARVCEMDPSRLGITAIKDILKAMFVVRPDDRTWASNYVTLDWLWDALVGLVNEDFRRVSMKMRQNWLDVTSYRHRRDLARTHAALEYLVEHGGGGGITKAAGRVLLRSKNEDASTIAVSLRLAAWCLARGVNVEEETLARIMTRLKLKYDAENIDGRTRVHEVAEGLIAELREGDAHRSAVPIGFALEHFDKLHRTAIEKAALVLDDPSATIERLLHTTTKLVQGTPGDAELEMALRLCNRALRMDADLEPILSTALGALGDRPLLALRLAQACFHTKAFQHSMSPLFMIRLFNSVLGALSSREAFDVVARLYDFARSPDADKRYKWMPPTIGQWMGFFFASLKHKRPHLASRLYADLQADGLSVPLKAQLAMIKSVASRRNDSRTTLLERHIKDYLWNESQPLDDLMVAIAQGMGSTGDPEDAARAVVLCRRLVSVEARDGPLPTRAVEALMTPLFTSSRSELRALGNDILAHVPGEEAHKAYMLALSVLVKNIRKAGLAQTIHLYRRMDASGVRTSAATASLLIMALLKSDHLDAALAIFKLASQHLGALKSATMGRLMIGLALAGRCDEAYQAEEEWRAHFPRGADYDKGVYGARLVVDFKAGKDVDTSIFASNEHGRVILKAHDGYKPTRPFFNFIDSLRPKEAKVEVVEEIEDESTRTSVRMPEPTDSHSKASASGVRCKQAVQPITRSWSTPGADGSGGWLLDRERQRVNFIGVSME